MQKILLLGISLFHLNFTFGQSFKKEIKTFQKEMNASYANRETSPLTEADFATFKGLPFFKADETFRVEAKFTPAQDTSRFKMKTTTDRLPEYRVFGTVDFKIGQDSFHMNIYQNLGLMQKPGYEDYLFFPFTDATNGEQSYGGGRYIDLRIPEGNTITIDFNKAYNPYCAYNKKYSCPIPPRENDMKIAVRAGVMYKHD
jgi:uncharacterized protein (DUF1684 family)